MVDGGANPLMAKTPEDYARIFEFVMKNPPFIPRPFLDVFAQERIQNYALEERIFQELRADSVEDRVRGLATPALVVTGDSDRAINPEAAKVYGQLLPNSKVLVYPGVGHLPMLENIQGSAEDYLAFRASLR